MVFFSFIFIKQNLKKKNVKNKRNNISHKEKQNFDIV